MIPLLKKIKRIILTPIDILLFYLFDFTEGEDHIEDKYSGN